MIELLTPLNLQYWRQRGVYRRARSDEVHYFILKLCGDYFPMQET